MSLFSRIIQMSKPSARPSSLVAGMSSLTVKLGLVLFFSSYSILFHFCTSSYRYFLFLLFFLFPSAMPFNFSYTEEYFDNYLPRRAEGVFSGSHYHHQNHLGAVRRLPEDVPAGDGPPAGARPGHRWSTAEHGGNYNSLQGRRLKV